MVLIILYSILFTLASISYIILESIRVNEIVIKKELNLPFILMSTLKIVPCILAIIFASLTIPKISILYILLPIYFGLFALGDLFMEIKKSLGTITYALGQMVICSGYLFTLIQAKNAIIERIIAFSFFGAVVLLLVITSVTFFNLYLSKSTNKEKYQKYKFLVLLYDILLSTHAVIAFLLTYISFANTPGIVVISIGILLLAISDRIIMIREFHFKIRKSVIVIMTTYYLAMYSISIQTLFPL